MEQKYVLGVDPGTGSLGLVVRDTETEELMEQVKYASVDIVRSGVIESGQNKYTSFAAERRGYRNARTRYLHRKWRKQETLKLLIDEKIIEGPIKHLLCPLSPEDLERWVRYDKTKGLKREYPVDAVVFVHWLRWMVTPVPIKSERNCWSVSSISLILKTVTNWGVPCIT